MGSGMRLPGPARWRWSLAVVPFLVAAAAAVPGRTVGADATGTPSNAGVAAFRPETVLVTFRPAAPAAQRLQAAQRLGLVVDDQHSTPSLAVLHLGDAARARGLTVAAAVAGLQRDAAVLAAEPDYRRRASVRPNDPMFDDLWGLSNFGQLQGTAGCDIGALTAWNSTTGSEKVVVAVVDTGIDYNHEDLTDNILRDASGAVVGYDFVNNDPDPMDDNEHGTHVAGTIGARGNNGVGVAGINWNVRLMPLKFLDQDGAGYDSDAVRAIDFAVAHGAQVINASWGGGDFGQALLAAIQRARDAGVLFVAAAGNESANNDTTPAYPANYNRYSSNVVSVAATDRNDGFAGFSNYGATRVDVAAPGVAILSTTPGNNYAVLDGTSMATPAVAGAYALLRARFPSLTLAEWKARLLDTVDHPTGVTGKVAAGRLNLGRAVGSDNGDQWEIDDTPETARAVQSGQVTSHTFHTGTDVDWVKFTVPGGAAVTAATYQLAAANDTAVELFDQDGATLLKSDDNSGGGRASRLTATLGTAGTYYLRVHDVNAEGGDNTGYRLVVSWSVPAVAKGDAWESDDTPAAARTVQSGQVTAHTFHRPGDVDWAKFTVRAGARVQASTAALTGSTDTVLELFDAGGTLLKADDNGAVGRASALSFTAPRAGTYFLRAREYHGWGGTGFGYQLAVRWTGGAGPLAR